MFMAVAMDLGNKSSIYGSIHPPDKQDVGFRLALAGRAIAYGDLDVYYSGPLVLDVIITSMANSTYWILTVEYHHESVGKGGIEVRSVDGFEVRSLNQVLTLRSLEIPIRFGETLTTKQHGHQAR